MPTLDEVLGPPVLDRGRTESSVARLEGSIKWRYPLDFRDAVLDYGGCELSGWVSTGPVRANYRSLRKLPALDGSWSHAGNLVDVFFNWSPEWAAIVPAQSADWIPWLVRIVATDHGSFFFDYAFDSVSPPVVFVDEEWDQPATGETFGGVVYVAKSFSAMLDNLIMDSDEFEHDKLWEVSPEESEWISHRTRMLGLGT